jgi:hypothetical protein
MNGNPKGNHGNFWPPLCLVVKKKIKNETVLSLHMTNAETNPSCNNRTCRDRYGLKSGPRKERKNRKEKIN